MHKLVRRVIEPVQDTLIVLLALALFGVMLRALWGLASALVAQQLSFRDVLSDALFVLVLTELERLLIIYLRDHHVSVDVMIEVTIVGVLREVLLLGSTQISPLQLFALTAFVLALGAMLRFGDLRAPRRRVRAHGGAPEPDR